jgi:starch-binding outer membrane protein, SusD/RagB family
MIMKTKILIAGLLSTALLTTGLTGCKKNLDLTDPFNLTPNNAFTDLASFQRQLNGVYGSFASPNYYNGFYGVTTEMLTDNSYETLESLVNFDQVHNWLYIASDPQRAYFQSMWLQIYNVILQANTIITKIDAVKGENERFYNRILGQALAARAIAHFDALKGWSDNNDRNGSGLGVPIKTNTDLTLPPRNTVKEVYDAIYADLNRAIELLGNTDAVVNSGTTRGFIDIWGARAALMRTALHANDNATAIAQATALINQFPLATRAQFPGIWNDANSVEQIWNIQNNAGDPGSPFPSAEVMSFRFNRSTFGALPAFIATFDTTGFGATGTSRDIRFNAYFFLRSTSANGNNNWALRKFAGKGASTDNLVNYKVFRVAEAYLTRAEALARTGGQEAGANADLNALKTARIDGWVNQTYTGAALVNEIAAERRRELCFENHRWFDLKRTNRILNRPLTNAGNPNGSVQTNLPANSNKWLWPVVEAELRANPNMQQNPGY